MDARVRDAEFADMPQAPQAPPFRPPMPEMPQMPPMPPQPLRADQKVPLILEAQEINVIIGGLSEVPYKYAAPLIEKIRQQAMQVPGQG